MIDDPRHSTRVSRERDAHTDRDVLAESYRLKNRFSHIWHYPSRQRLFSEVERLSHNVAGQVVLDYGCGRGESSLKYLTKGATVKGIDISPTYVSDARTKANEAGFSPERYEFLVMDAHQLAFDSESFDLVIGEGILHHLEAHIALSEIHRVLRPGGRAVFQEPLADNPLLKLFRLLTPRARTEDEAPFTGHDIHRLLRSDRWESHTMYCGLVGAPVAMITSVLLPDRPHNPALRIADKVEKWFHAHELLLSWNQYILLNLVKR